MAFFLFLVVEQMCKKLSISEISRSSPLADFTWNVIPCVILMSLNQSTALKLRLYDNNTDVLRVLVFVPLLITFLLIVHRFLGPWYVFSRCYGSLDAQKICSIFRSSHSVNLFLLLICCICI